MLSRSRRIIAALCALVLLAGAMAPSVALATDDDFINSSGTKANDNTSPFMVDLLILRPIGLLTLGMSAIFFVIPVVPLTLMTRPSELKAPFETLIINPAKYVWVDPLGSH